MRDLEGETQEEGGGRRRRMTVDEYSIGAISRFEHKNLRLPTLHHT